MPIDFLNPVELGSLTLPYCFFSDPLTRMRATTPGKLPGELKAAYYRQRAISLRAVTAAMRISYSYSPSCWLKAKPWNHYLLPETDTLGTGVTESEGRN